MSPNLPVNFMHIALKAARHAQLQGEVPVGAVIVKNHQIIAIASNLTRNNYDPTGHAEIRAIRIAAKKLQAERLIDCDLYVTLEPCNMCAAAISFARIRRLYYAASDYKGGAVEHNTRFFHQPSCFHKPEIYPSIAEREARRLLKDFFLNKR